MLISHSPRRRRDDRAFFFSLLLSLLLHAGAVGAVVLLKPHPIEVHLHLQSGEEAMALDVGASVESAPSPALPEIAEAKFANAPPPMPFDDEKRFLEDDPPPEAASRLQGNLELERERPLERVEARPRQGRPLTDQPRRRYHRQVEEPEAVQPEALARLPETVEEQEKTPPESAAPSTASQASVASVLGAEARSRGVIQRIRPLGALVPEYPQGARRRGEEGEVLVSAAIDAAGRCAWATVERSSGYPDLDNAALDTVRRASFVPASEDGIPIAMADRFIIEFRLR
ncbi:MAG: TonB family protein [Planctomycetaceae bacterium]|nr:TonB family protein [Planctomycetaceae bacterium]